MATKWFAGRGKSGANGAYVVRRNNIQSWVNRSGSLSLPENEVRTRIKKSHETVLFYDLIHGTKYITHADNFRNGEEVQGKIVVDIEKFDIVYRQDGVE